MKRFISFILSISITLSCMVFIAPMASAASNDYTTWRQSDPAWNKTEAWPASQYPNATLRYMSQAGCLVTSIAMLLRHYNVVTDSNVNSFNPWVCNEKLKSAGAFNSAADLVWGSIENAYSGFKYAGSTSYSASKLYDLYKQGYACIVAVNNYGHYVAVKSASSSGSVIMDPGWGYTSLSSFRSINSIFYFSVKSSAEYPHTCNKGEYVYYWKAHPHPNCYRCSICGKVWADSSSSRYIADCDACNTITVTTKAAVDITETTAGLPGSYYNPGGKTISEYGAKFGTSKDNLSQTASLIRNESYKNGGIPAYVVRNLTPGTTYYYRSYVVSNGVTYYGDILSFTTTAKANMWSENINFPSTIQKGENPVLTGTIRSNLGVKWVFIGIGHSEGVGSQNAIQKVDDPVWKTGGTNSYSIQRIASSFDFSTLEPGNYWLSIQCMDNQNNYFHVYEHGFSVKDSAPTYHTVTLDPNGGTVPQTIVQFPHGFVLTTSSLPVPVSPYESLVFTKWYDTSGKPVTAGYVITEDMELCAHWTRKTPPSSGTSVHFTKPNTYTQGQFSDVPASQWFTENVAAAVEFGLMKGTSSSTFNPYGDVTLAEAITMAARIHSIYTTGDESFVQSADNAWYQVYLDYAYQNGIIDRSYYNADVQQKATRAQYAEIFANALPDEALFAQNDVPDNAIPDVSISAPYAPAVYKLYRAGILAGGDANGTFSPLTYITRAESATIVARMADSENRMSFSL